MSQPAQQPQDPTILTADETLQVAKCCQLVEDESLRKEESDKKTTGEDAAGFRLIDEIDETLKPHTLHVLEPALDYLRKKLPENENTPRVDVVLHLKTIQEISRECQPDSLEATIEAFNNKHSIDSGQGFKLLKFGHRELHDQVHQPEGDAPASIQQHSNETCVEADCIRSSLRCLFGRIVPRSLPGGDTLYDVLPYLPIMVVLRQKGSHEHNDEGIEQPRRRRQDAAVGGNMEPYAQERGRTIPRLHREDATLGENTEVSIEEENESHRRSE
ncbi:hypothetical protein CORC01_02420 [Colletotrichum orchidophilum]|uniref:Uncharacterized protein n=1 Tax=Colletotrichum orchidophilum TaxID=1209926 RepID=A0A1G4BKZ5_9PEZI|nr:uncharacterized protein CORC01_02420 [Colletotrichum orchidophilum]OHF02140.1 hypothetical protein CORC01_02420 [Colletotrichum orchidophilum]